MKRAAWIAALVLGLGVIAGVVYWLVCRRYPRQEEEEYLELIQREQSEAKIS